MSYVWKSHDAHVKESWRTCRWVMLHMWRSHVTFMCDIYALIACTCTTHIHTHKHTRIRTHTHTHTHTLIAIPLHAVDNWWNFSKISSLVILCGEFSREQTLEKSYQPILWSFRRLPAFTHTHPHIHTHAHTHIYMRTHTHTHTHIDADTDTHACTQARTHGRTDACPQRIYIYIHVHVHPRASTHKHHRQTVMTAN